MFAFHYNDVILSAMATQITSLAIFLLKRLFRRRSKNTSKLRVTGLCKGNSPVTCAHKGPVTRKMFSFDDVIMCKIHKFPSLFQESFASNMPFTFTYTYSYQRSSITCSLTLSRNYYHFPTPSLIISLVYLHISFYIYLCFYVYLYICARVSHCHWLTHTDLLIIAHS